jgi:UDP-N-acetylbacillosamine N-acetyltransferase
MSTKKKLVIWGASGHALVIADIICLRGKHEIVGFLDDIHPDRKNFEFCGCKVLGGREQLSLLREQGVDRIVLGFGDCNARIELSRLVLKLGFSLATAIHPSAIVATDASVGAGTVIVAQSVVNPGAIIGENVIINTSASVGHESIIEDGVHIAPGVHLGGRVKIGRGTWVGIGSTVRANIHIGSNSLIGVGSVVVSNIPNGVVAYGVPAKVIRKNKSKQELDIH